MVVPYFCENHSWLGQGFSVWQNAIFARWRENTVPDDTLQNMENFIRLREEIDNEIERIGNLVTTGLLEEVAGALAGLKEQFEALNRIRDTENEVHDRVLSRLHFELKKLEEDLAKAMRSAKRRGRKKTARTKKAAKTEGGLSADRRVPPKSRARSGAGAGRRTPAKRTAQPLPPDYKRVMDVLRLLQIDHRADLSELHYDKVLKWIDMLERYESVDAKTLKSLNNLVKKYKLHYLFDGEEVDRRFSP
jgi:hypothetical protein